MELPNLMYCILPLKKREELYNKRNVKVINEFLKKRKKLQIAKEDDLAHLKQLRKNRSIDKSMYQRLKKVMISTYEKKRIDLLESTTEKSVRKGKSVNRHYNQSSEDYQPPESEAANN